MATTDTFSIPLQKISRRLVAVLAVFGLLLACLDLLISAPGWDYDGGISVIFNLTREDGIGDYYSATITLFAALLAWAVYYRERKRAWFWLALLLTYTSMDDGSRVHEGVGGAVHRYFYHHYPHLPLPGYLWQLVFAPVFAALLLLGVYVGLRHIQARYSRLALFSGLGLLVLAVGMDFLEGFGKIQSAWFAEFVSDAHPFNQHLVKVIEETIESFSFGLIVSSFLNHIAVTYPQWKLEFTS